MRSGTVARVTAVGLLLVLSGAMAALAPDGSPGAKLPSSLALVTDEVALPDHALTRPLSASTELSIALTLPYSHSVTLSRFLSNVEDPASPAYRHFLTEPQFVSEFGPTPTTVQEVTSELRSSGALDLSVTPSHNVVSAVLSAGAVEHLLGISILQYGTADGLPLYSAVGTPVLPDALSGDVIGVGGLSDGADPLLSFDLHAGALSEVPGSRASQFVLSNTSGEWFVGSDFTQAYGASSLFPGGSIGANGTFPVHLAIATLLASGYNESTNQNLPGWDPSVIQTYFNDTLPKSWPQPTVRGVPVDVDGIAAPAPGSFGSLNDSSLDEFENSLDLEMAGSLAPGASLYNFYFAGSLLTGSTPIGDLADDFADDLNAALVFPYAPDTLGVVSGSFGLPDLNDSAWDSDLTMAAGTGVTVVMASGDQGDAPDSMTGRGDGPWPVWPASVAFNTTGVTSVGGVSLSLDGVPTTTFNGSSLNVTFDSNLTGIGGMSAWWDTTGCPTLCAGTEGGISAVYPEPYWQLHSAAQPDIVRAARYAGRDDAREGRSGRRVPGQLDRRVRLRQRDRGGLLHRPRRDERRGPRVRRIGRRPHRGGEPLGARPWPRVPRPHDLHDGELLHRPSGRRVTVPRCDGRGELRVLGDRRMGRHDGLGRTRGAPVPRGGRKPGRDRVPLLRPDARDRLAAQRPDLRPHGVRDPRALRRARDPGGDHLRTAHPPCPALPGPFSVRNGRTHLWPGLDSPRSRRRNPIVCPDRRLRGPAPHRRSKPTQPPRSCAPTVDRSGRRSQSVALGAARCRGAPGVAPTRAHGRSGRSLPSDF